MKRIVVSTCIAALMIVTLSYTLQTRAVAEGQQINSNAPPPLSGTFVPGRILVKFRPHIGVDQARQIIAGLGARDHAVIQGIGVHILDLPYQANEEAFVNAFQKRPEVQFAELDKILAPAEVHPNDPYYADWEWHLQKIAAPSAWSITTGDSRITVAILDTGLLSTHPDLAENVVPGWNVYNDNADTTDVTGHGTMVAGTAAALSNNSIGVASVAWNCRIMPVRITDANGYANYSTMASGITWAADNGARVANLSFNGVDGLTVTASADYFQQKGGVVITAAGNDGSLRTTADNESLVNVSATDGSDLLYTWSTRGENIDVAAPGSVYTTNYSGSYSSAAGTSVAAPIVAGAAALIFSVNPNLTPLEVKEILRQSADDLGPTGWDTSYGAGRVNVARAVRMAGGASASDTLLPVISISSPTDSTQVSGTISVLMDVYSSVGVAKVVLYVDGKAESTTTTAPYTVRWNTRKVKAGAHTLRSVVFDVAGASAESNVVRVMK